MRLIVLSADGFRRPLDGVSRPLHEIVNGLSRDHDVQTMIGAGEIGSEDNQILVRGSTSAIPARGHLVGHPSTWRKFGGRPLAEIHSDISAQGFDVAVCYHASTVYLVPDGLPIVLVGQDVLANLISRQASLGTAFRQRVRVTASARYMRWAEGSAYRRSHAVTVVSESEVAVAQELYGVTPVVNANGVGLQRPEPLTSSGRNGLVFLGNLSAPKNAAAAEAAARQILPLLREHHPDVGLRIVGPGASNELTSIDQVAGVTLVGPVDDLATELLQARALIAPHDVATGIKNAVLDAMAHGLPVIGSTQVLRPIVGDVAGLALELHDATAITGLYETLQDADNWLGYAERAYGHVRDHFSWERYVAQLETLCGQAMKG